ncbi:ribonuclease [Massilia sp. CF038]|uniref:ribonuclease T2 family protein n=1 Tax=Massilia sp. CF038 TaxID=1881045 RepID=UPI000923572C|nr:ribonuclease [Massilia sp. CF038]SHG40253.1 ribonuclease T2 [Massilia sp. CF038]
MRPLHQLLLFVMLSLAASAQARRGDDAPGRFDYYAVALSWSPSYCATNRDPDQCDSGRKLGFVLHGLWPQYEAGYPQECSREPLPGAVRGKYAAIYPSEKLIGHEWKKHGTCSGLDPAAYFALSARLKNQVVIPRQFQQPAQPVRVANSDFVQAFKAVNPGMARDSVLPFCSGGGRFLREIHACFDKNGQSRSCSNGEIKRSYSSCRQQSFLLESVR